MKYTTLCRSKEMRTSKRSDLIVIEHQRGEVGKEVKSHVHEITYPVVVQQETAQTEARLDTAWLITKAVDVVVTKTEPSEARERFDPAERGQFIVV